MTLIKENDNKNFIVSFERDNNRIYISLLQNFALFREMF